MSVQIFPAFAVPFGTVRLSDCASLNQALISLFLGCRDNGAQYANPTTTMRIHEGLFESRFDLFTWPEASIRQLREFCWSSMYSFIAELNGLQATQLQEMRGHADAWFHIAGRGGHFEIHNHPMASWSGVYCVAPGGDPAVVGGHLTFPHPNGGANMFRDAANASVRSPFGFNTLDFALQPGQLVLFPSWLPHLVTSYCGDDLRITVAFNAWFTKDRQAAR